MRGQSLVMLTRFTHGLASSLRRAEPRSTDTIDEPSMARTTSATNAGSV